MNRIQGLCIAALVAGVSAPISAFAGEKRAGGAETTVSACEAAEEGGATAIAAASTTGVEREMKESGEKGGTEDINIGVGELQECTSAETKPATATATPSRVRKKN